MPSSDLALGLVARACPEKGGSAVFAERTFLRGEVLAIFGGEVRTLPEVLEAPPRLRGEFPSRCGSSACRGFVRGDDWRRPDVAERYRGFFSTHLTRRLINLEPRRTRARRGAPACG